MSPEPGAHAPAPPPGSVGIALVVHPVLGAGSRHDPDGATARAPTARLDEAIGLARAIDLTIAGAELVPLRTPRPATLIGSGQVERLGALIAERAVGVVVVDAALSPVQQRNLERAWKAKVIDRTGLILEIFGARARTHEGRLQVELAALTYQRSRLVRSWTHLERQRGGFGFLGGPGESQIELDRRLIGDRIAKLKRELGGVRRTRELHRSARRRVPYPIVALVGYTNAGKSTLFNRLTRASVLAEDLLFATLDPTMRGVTLESGRRIILSDTVGFISNLPTQLVAAFRATLEEVLEADVIVHVRDIAHPDSDAQRDDVEAVLSELGIGEVVDHGLLEAWNKLDLLPADERAALAQRVHGNHNRVLVSALTGEGCDRLTARLDDALSSRREILRLDVDLADGRMLAWLYDKGEVLSRNDQDQTARLTVALDPPDVARFRRQFPDADRPH
ncbi:MAG TPA: GTPase HflX [Candidatus Sulfotelmatobacter sp.]|nr:GTPase HflX [Candidatus Sulfotelmatobacter sp.]